MAKEMTLADHAEAWWREQGHEVPARDSDEWQADVRDLGDLGLLGPTR